MCLTKIAKNIGPDVAKQRDKRRASSNLDPCEVHVTHTNSQPRFSSHSQTTAWCGPSYIRLCAKAVLHYHPRLQEVLFGVRRHLGSSVVDILRDVCDPVCRRVAISVAAAGPLLSFSVESKHVRSPTLFVQGFLMCKKKRRCPGHLGRSVDDEKTLRKHLCSCELIKQTWNMHAGEVDWSSALNLFFTASDLGS